MNSELNELRATVDARAGQGGQSRQSKVTPEGTIQLPAIGSIPAQGLTLNELKAEVEQRYDEIVSGLEITPILVQRAPRFVYVTGEVLAPGRYTLEAPTTLIQAIALAGSWNVGADLENIVILRRDENWQLMATKVNMHRALFGKEPCPEGEIWLRDSDIVLLPKSPLLWTDNLIELIFTRGIYGVVPVQYTAIVGSLSKL
jgi:polysaccharide export outer membrane protein